MPDCPVYPADSRQSSHFRLSIIVFLFALCFLWRPSFSFASSSAGNATDSWRQLAPGLAFGEFSLPGREGQIAALRINPEDYDFILCSAAQDKASAATLKDWTEAKGLIAAINASMYLPDNRTSTGYMRSGAFVNNGRIVDRFGAFFAAGPRKEGIARARIIDKDEKNWRQTLDDYDMVIQNYRMTNANGRILWSPGGPLYAISAVAQDADGNILFLHCRQPLHAYAFVEGLLALPLNVRTVMYVEGGAQAGMVVDAGGMKRDLGSIHAPSLLVTGNFRAALPNVLGVKPRKMETKELYKSGELDKDQGALPGLSRIHDYRENEDIMTKVQQVYKCDECGNIVEVLHAGDGELVCCGKPMRLLKAGSTDGAQEKHVPAIEKKGNGYHVQVGSVAHPMEEKHHIEWIELITDDGRVYRKFLKPGEKPEAVFSDVDAKGVTVQEYCNLHGLWKAEA